MFATAATAAWIALYPEAPRELGALIAWSAIYLGLALLVRRMERQQKREIAS